MNKEDYFKYYIQGSDHYLIPKDVFDELFEEMESCKHDTQKYKEVIDKIKKEIKKELKENNHISYGVALSIIVTLNYYEEILKGETNE